MALAVPFRLLQWLEMQQGIVMILSNTLSLSFLLFFFFILFMLRHNSTTGSWSQKPNILPPSPPKFPIIGNLHQLFGTLTHRSLRDLSQKYGSIMLLHMGSNPTVVVSSRDAAREIMKNNDIVFANRPFTRSAMTLLYGCSDIAFSPYGEYWRETKKICIMKLLSIKKVQSFKFVREEEVGLMVEKISHLCSLETPINLSEIVLTLAKNVISRCALGKKYGKDGDKRLEELPRKVSKLMGTFNFKDLFPWLGWMDVVTGLVRRLKRTARELDTFFDQVIEEHLTRDNKCIEDHDFVDLLLQSQKDQKLDINLTRDNIKAIILDMFVAGIETTANTIEWCIAELVRNPNVMKNAQEEVRRVVGKKRKVDEEDIRQMDYLICVIKETFRLYPAAPTLLPRESYESSKVGGYHIPVKTRVLINAWAIQRDPELWVDAEEFIPERFMSKTVDFKGQDFEFIPFGSGRRICPGLSFGVATVEFAIANLLYWFDWELPDDDTNYKDGLDMTEDFGIGLGRKTPLHLAPILHFP